MLITIIGHFAKDNDSNNGQTVKTKNLSFALSEIDNVRVTELDTYGWKKHPIRLFKKLWQAMKSSDAIIMLPANNGLKIFAPLIVCLNKKYKKKIYYDVVGGWLPEFLKNRSNLQKKLKKFDGIWVETPSMQNRMLELGFKNVVVVPNFKTLKPLDTSELAFNYTVPLSFCVFCRITKQKGISEAINAIREINLIREETVAALDIFGQIDPAYEEEFNKLLCENKGYVNYKGIVQPSNSVEVLKNYFMLLFPTYYDGEGFAGTLIDAFASGLPIISSDWRYNPEIVQNGINGFLFETKNQQDFIEKIDFSLQNLDIINQMRYNCLEEYKKYSYETAVEKIKGLICE